MSWDINLTVTVDGHLIEIPGTDFNYTHNTNPMMYDAGFPSWATLSGTSSAEFCQVLGAALERLEAAPDKYRKMNPENGWGDYDRLVTHLREILRVFSEFPSATVQVSV